MSTTKKFVKNPEQDFIEAYQVEKDTWIDLNTLGWDDPGYHGTMPSHMQGKARKGDYVIKLYNGMFMIMLKEDFERIFKPLEG